MNLSRILLFLLLSTLTLRADDFLGKARRIVFLGDSITYAGQYVDFIEAFLAVKFPERAFDIVDVGLPSETASGLSEDGHAGGAFPRPGVHERLDRVLAKTKPDLVFACYGMNDGIYLPFAEERFAKFRAGIERLRAKVEAAGAKIIHLTPPTFDAGPIKNRAVAKDAKGSDKPFEVYNDTLGRYSEWLLARAVLDGLGQATDDFTTNARYADVIKLVRERGRILADAWLTDTGHLRPGMNKGLPLADAQAKAAELDPKIREAAAALAGNP